MVTCFWGRKSWCHLCLREENIMVTCFWGRKSRWSPMSEGGNHNGHLCLRRKSWCQLCLRRKSWWSHMSEGGNHDGHIGLREEIMMSPMSEGRNHNGHLCLREENISFDYKMCGFWLSLWYLQSFLLFYSTSHEDANMIFTSYHVRVV